VGERLSSIKAACIEGCIRNLAVVVNEEQNKEALLKLKKKMMRKR
jgi:hypothetical protein